MQAGSCPNRDRWQHRGGYRNPNSRLAGYAETLRYAAYGRFPIGEYAAPGIVTIWTPIVSRLPPGLWELQRHGYGAPSTG